LFDWGIIKERLKSEVKESTYNAWFSRMELIEVQDDTIFIQFPNEFVLQWVEDRYLYLLREIIHSISGKNFILKFLAKNNNVERNNYVTVEEEKSEFKTNLVDRYLFDTFVVGKNNQFAHAAALAVAKGPGRAYNPLFIYGGVGLGKTHLMHAIGNYVYKLYSNLKILYLPSEVFMNEMITALSNKKMLEFKNFYRNIDVLLVDDIQFLSHKERLQEEFFHTFNTLFQTKRQIVITSDRPPKELEALEERIKSRFHWGLIVDIQPPDLETRVAILRKKAEEDNLIIGDDIIYYIATNIRNNIRALEGALIKLLYWSSLTKSEITLETATEVLKDIVTPKKKRYTPEEIQRVVCNHFNLTINDLTGKKRLKSMVLPRQIAIYIIRKLTNLSLNEIGHYFGNRDHTTIIHAIEKMESDIKSNKEIKDIIQRIISEFTG